MKTRNQIWNVLALLALSVPAAADARPPRSRTWRGTVTAIEAAGQKFTITDACRHRKALGWDKATQFVAKVHFITADAIRQGALVEVRYRSPFFGGPYATKVILLCGSTPQTQTNKS